MKQKLMAFVLAVAIFISTFSGMRSPVTMIAYGSTGPSISPYANFEQLGPNRYFVSRDTTPTISIRRGNWNSTLTLHVHQLNGSVSKVENIPATDDIYNYTVYQNNDPDSGHTFYGWIVDGVIDTPVGNYLSSERRVIDLYPVFLKHNAELAGDVYIRAEFSSHTVTIQPQGGLPIEIDHIKNVAINSSSQYANGCYYYDLKDSYRSVTPYVDELTHGSVSLVRHPGYNHEYTLYDQNGNILARNNTGVFDNLTPATTYIVKQQLQKNGVAESNETRFTTLAGPTIIDKGKIHFEWNAGNDYTVGNALVFRTWYDDPASPKPGDKRYLPDYWDVAYTGPGNGDSFHGDWASDESIRHSAPGTYQLVITYKEQVWGAAGGWSDTGSFATHTEGYTVKPLFASTSADPSKIELRLDKSGTSPLYELYETVKLETWYAGTVAGGSPQAGDERYLPVAWESSATGNNRQWGEWTAEQNGSYQDSFSHSEQNTYRLTVSYKKQVYEMDYVGNGKWVDAGNDRNTISSPNLATKSIDFGVSGETFKANPAQIAFEDVGSGLSHLGTYNQGQAIIFETWHNGSAKPPILGDQRFTVTSWTTDFGSRQWQEGQPHVLDSFIGETPGSYTLYVTYQMEQYIADGVWQPFGTSLTQQYPYTVQTSSAPHAANINHAKVEIISPAPHYINTDINFRAYYPMSDRLPVIGDERYVPVRWETANNKAGQLPSPHQDVFQQSIPGNPYTLRVWFQKEECTQGGAQPVWTPVGAEEAQTLDYVVVQGVPPHTASENNVIVTWLNPPHFVDQAINFRVEYDNKLGRDFVIGDERLVPVSWQTDDIIGSWDRLTADFIAGFTRDADGSYILKVRCRKQEYTGDPLAPWKDTNDYVTVSVPYTVANTTNPHTADQGLISFDWLDSPYYVDEKISFQTAYRGPTRSPVAGDERYVPVRWETDSLTGAWSASDLGSYKDTFTRDKDGNYSLRVWYKKQTFTAGKWEDTADSYIWIDRTYTVGDSSSKHIADTGRIEFEWIGKPYYVNEDITFETWYDGPNRKAIVGDERYIPLRWSTSSSSGRWSRAPYRDDFRRSSSGDYRLRVWYQKQECTVAGSNETWRDIAGEIESITYPYTVHRKGSYLSFDSDKRRINLYPSPQIYTGSETIEYIAQNLSDQDLLYVMVAPVGKPTNTMVPILEYKTTTRRGNTVFTPSRSWMDKLPNGEYNIYLDFEDYYGHVTLIVKHDSDNSLLYDSVTYNYNTNPKTGR